MSRSYTRMQSAMEERVFRFKRERQGDHDEGRPEYMPQPLAAPVHYRTLHTTNDRMAQELKKALSL